MRFSRLLIMTTLHTYPDTRFPAGDDAPTVQQEDTLERGGVLHFPQLRFDLRDDEKRFLDTRWSDGRAKNISLRGAHDPRPGALRGAAGPADALIALQGMLTRYRDDASALVDRLFPHYRGQLTVGNTSFRPFRIEGRPASWRKDDSRLHVDAFPSNPTQGQRLLRVFANLNPDGVPRRWRVGEPFEAHAQRFLPRIRPAIAGWAPLAAALGITKSLRTPYDHLMLGLHDQCKADTDYQRDAPQCSVDFTPGTTWVVFSDQVLHAAMAGQFMMEQTFYLAPGAERDPNTSPCAILERLTGRRLR